MDNSFPILVTGANGFVGKALCERLTVDEFSFRCVARKPIQNGNFLRVDTVGSATQWAEALHEIHTVIHAAARTHVMEKRNADSLAIYREVNVEGTLNLARQAAALGIKRFIFLSSVKVNGEQTALNNFFSEKNKPDPLDPYGISKLEAEDGLRLIAKETGLEVVVVRPPLVYGPGVKGNFATMINWVKKGYPLPLGAISNNRSLVALENLIDFLILCADPTRSPNAGNQTFLISDGEDISTTELLRKVAKAYGVKSSLLPVPVSFMKVAAKLLGKSAVADRLFGNLQVDSSKARELLGWQPVITMDEQLRKMAEAEQGSIIAI